MAGWRGRPIGRTARGRLPRHAYPRERLPSRRRVARGRLLFTCHAGPCKGEGPPSLHLSCWPLQRRGAASSSLVMLALAKTRSRLLFTRHAGPCKGEEPPPLHSSRSPLQRRGAGLSSLVMAALSGPSGPVRAIRGMKAAPRGAANDLFTFWGQSPGHAHRPNTVPPDPGLSAARLRGGGACRGRGGCYLGRQRAGVRPYAGRHGGVGGLRAGLLGGSFGQGRALLPGGGKTAGNAGILHKVAGGAGLLERSVTAARHPARARRRPADVDTGAGEGPDEAVAVVVVTGRLCGRKTSLICNRRWAIWHFSKPDNFDILIRRNEMRFFM